MAGNKVLKKVSKKTLGKSVDTVADYVDLLSQMIVEYFNQRYKIKKKVEDVKENVLDALYGFKSQVFRSTIELFLLITGFASLIVGIIIYLTRYTSLDMILIVYGLIISLGVLLTARLKKPE